LIAHNNLVEHSGTISRKTRLQKQYAQACGENNGRANSRKSKAQPPPVIKATINNKTGATT